MCDLPDYICESGFILTATNNKKRTALPSSRMIAQKDLSRLHDLPLFQACGTDPDPFHNSVNVSPHPL